MVSGIGAALREEMRVGPRFGGYLNADIAEIDVRFKDQPDPSVNTIGTKTLGIVSIVSIVSVSAAISNATVQATGTPVRHLPIRTDDELGRRLMAGVPMADGKPAWRGLLRPGQQPRRTIAACRFDRPGDAAAGTASPDQYVSIRTMPPARVHERPPETFPALHVVAFACPNGEPSPHRRFPTSVAAARARTGPHTYTPPATDHGYSSGADDPTEPSCPSPRRLMPTENDSSCTRWYDPSTIGRGLGTSIPPLVRGDPSTTRHASRIPHNGTASSSSTTCARC